MFGILVSCSSNFNFDEAGENDPDAIERYELALEEGSDETREGCYELVETFF